MAATLPYERLLLDTNIPSELTRHESAPAVEQWLEDANDAELHFSVISLGEILRSIAVLPASKRRVGLQEWLDSTLRPWFEGRILPVTAAIAERWGVLSGRTPVTAPIKPAAALFETRPAPDPQDPSIERYPVPERSR